MLLTPWVGAAIAALVLLCVCFSLYVSHTSQPVGEVFTPVVD
ncbi:putative membrane protein [Collimonas arenae]|uniref:Putative membrane protein n=1 Tax=Collimonas arenae TaxID=279058 RepID=A0A127PJW6_9BURK|nr:hypothetical protein [Collimonas arenae]AMO98096.1 putative membrane protein [Collimonas arenae]AMP07963.1 putative membrane protein [Collimonas arenae]